MLEKLRARVSTVVDDGRNLLREIDFFRDIPNRPVPDYIRDRREYSRKINEDYFAWYNAARPIVQAHLPESFDYFEQMFLNSLEKARNLLGTSVDSTYRNDAMLRDLEDAVATQLGIVRAVPEAIESKALVLRGLLARDLMEDELSAARHLLDSGYVREAGVLAGVILEHHLRLMCEKRAIALTERESIGTINDKLKTHYPDLSQYRRIQYLKEMRDKCAHASSPPPDATMVEQLVSGVRDVISTIS